MELIDPKSEPQWPARQPMKSVDDRREIKTVKKKMKYIAAI